PLYFLHGVKDTREQWHVLRHAPTSLERETHSLANLFLQDAEGNLQRCSSGLVVCLADDIRKHEWEWLQRLWEVAFERKPRTAVGATLVWSDRAHETQMDDFLNTRGPTTHRLLHSLISSGAPLCSAVNVRHLANATGTLLVLNPHLYPQDELRALSEYRNGPLVLIGPKIDLARKPDLQFEDPCSHDGAWCSVYGLQAPPVGIRIELDSHAEEIPDFEEINEPSTFLKDLYCRQVTAGFLRACAEVLVACSQGVEILRPSEGVQVMAFGMDEGEIRLLLGNDRHSYVTASVDVGRGIADIEVLSPFPLFPLTPSGSIFSVKIPGRGMVVVGVRV
ncbi:MAG: hypothetical protein HY318_07270, partial [Armatimonadetes bacterium]|nr:hypothetical protein [Armatimonadota bacterium]